MIIENKWKIKHLFKAEIIHLAKFYFIHILCVYLNVSLEDRIKIKIKVIQFILTNELINQILRLLKHTKERGRDDARKKRRERRAPFFKGLNIVLLNTSFLIPKKTFCRFFSFKILLLFIHFEMRWRILTVNIICILKAITLRLKVKRPFYFFSSNIFPYK